MRMSLLYFGRKKMPSVFCFPQLRNDFLNSYQPFIMIIQLQLDSNKSSGVKKQAKDGQHCAWTH